MKKYAVYSESGELLPGEPTTALVWAHEGGLPLNAWCPGGTWAHSSHANSATRVVKLRHIRREDVVALVERLELELGLAKSRLSESDTSNRVLGPWTELAVGVMARHVDGFRAAEVRRDNWAACGVGYDYAYGFCESFLDGMREADRALLGFGWTLTWARPHYKPNRRRN